MERLYQLYLNNIALARNLTKPQINFDMPKYGVIRVIHECAEQLNQIHQEDDKILKEILFSKSADTLSRYEVENLKELADQLFNYNRSPDVGIAYRIHKLLYEYGLLHQDKDLIVRELYFQGITLMYLDIRESELDISLFSDEIQDFFYRGAQYMDEYEELKNPETRAYIIRCLGNLKYTTKKNSRGMPDWDSYMEGFTRAMSVIESPYYREMNPEIAWDTFAYTMHFDRTKFLSNLRNEKDPIIAKAVLESAEFIYQRQEEAAKIKEKAVSSRIRYIYKAAYYHAGLIPIEDLMEELFELCEGADLHDFSSDNIWILLSVPEYLIHYSGDLSKVEQEEIHARLEAILAKQEEYLFLLPWDEYGLQISRALQTITNFLSSQGGENNYRLLNYLLACHPPTYVHSQVVALLTGKLCQQLIKTNPQALKEVEGYRQAEISGNFDGILKLAYFSGLYHDLGKCMLLNHVGLYSRSLLDEEFKGIKLHPMFGSGLLRSLHMGVLCDVAFYHHCSYDRKSGYPFVNHGGSSSIRPIVDIITVVDSLDAGTDNIGRSYATAKTYEVLVEELRQGKGTRYSPLIVNLFDDPDFYFELKEYLMKIRYDTYIDAYCSKR